MRQSESEHLRITGKVIEIIEKSGKPVAVVSVEPFYLDIHAEGMQDVHLSDKVLLDIEMSVKRIESEFNGHSTTIEL